MALPIAAQAGAQMLPGVIGGIYSYKKSGKKTPQERAAEAAMGQAQDLINLSLSPDDPRFKAMVEAESQGVRGGFLQNLRDMIEGNRRQALMGRQQFFDPERRDQTMFSAVDKAGRDAQLHARSNVLERINGAIQRLQGQQSGYMKLADMEAGRRDQKRQAILGGLSAGGQGMNSYFNRPQIPQSLGGLQ